MLIVSHATRSYKEEDVNLLWEMIQSKYDFKDLFTQLADENKADYNGGFDNYKIVMTDRDKKRIVFVDMEFSHFSSISVYENGSKVAALEYVDLNAERARLAEVVKKDCHDFNFGDWEGVINDSREQLKRIDFKATNKVSNHQSMDLDNWKDKINDRREKTNNAPSDEHDTKKKPHSMNHDERQ